MWNGRCNKFLVNSLSYEFIQMQNFTTAEIVIIRVKLGNKLFIIVNAYLPPYSRRQYMANELGIVIESMRKHLPNDEIIVLGDLNMTNVSWVQSTDDEDAQGIGLKTAGGSYSIFERNMLNILQSNALYQIVDTPNRLGNFLDVIFTSDCANVTYQLPEESEVMFNANNDHRGHSLRINFRTDAEPECTTAFIKTKSIQYQRSLATVRAFKYTYISAGDIDNSLAEDEESISRKIMKATDEITQTIEAFSITNTFKLPNANSNHPWTRDKMYNIVSCSERGIWQKEYTY